MHLVVDGGCKGFALFVTAIPILTSYHHFDRGTENRRNTTGPTEPFPWPPFHFFSVTIRQDSYLL